jgi:hypothetical protein
MDNTKKSLDLRIPIEKIPTGFTDENKELSDHTEKEVRSSFRHLAAEWPRIRVTFTGQGTAPGKCYAYVIAGLDGRYSLLFPYQIITHPPSPRTQHLGTGLLLKNDLYVPSTWVDPASSRSARE